MSHLEAVPWQPGPVIVAQKIHVRRRHPGKKWAASEATPRAVGSSGLPQFGPEFPFLEDALQARGPVCNYAIHASPARRNEDGRKWLFALLILYNLVRIEWIDPKDSWKINEKTLVPQSSNPYRSVHKFEISQIM